MDAKKRRADVQISQNQREDNDTEDAPDTELAQASDEVISKRV